MNAGDRAMRRAAFLGEEFALPPGLRVLIERNAGVAPLLRAVVHEAVFANVEVARPGAASPFVLAPRGDVVLESIHARERTLSERHDLFEDFLFTRAERLK